jgi:ribose transport system ATP-binding protein
MGTPVDDTSRSAATISGPTDEPMVRVRGLTKAFDGIAVLRDADMDIYGGRIQALVGANGSGKSTLIKILSGYHAPSAGRVTVVPDLQTGREPKLAFVHQDLGLVESMSVLENVALACGYSTGALGRVRWKAMRAEAAELLERFGLHVHANAEMGTLGGTERRLVAIARATHSLGHDRGVLVLDEPTAALPGEEVHRVFDVMKIAAHRGAAVLFVSHNLAETLDMAHSVTVLRNGRIVAQVLSADTSVEQLADAMFGAAGDSLIDPDSVHAAVLDGSGPVEAHRDAAAADRTTPALRLEAVSANRLKDVSIDVWAGEVVGVTGLVGCGKSELGRVLAGSQPATSGTISVNGSRPRPIPSPRAALDLGIAFVPPDRRRSGGILTMDARENITLSTMETFFKGGRLRKRAELKSVKKQMREVGAVPANPKLPFASFSGGNQQKLVLARVLRLAPRVVVLDDPTQGVDVETIPELYRFIRQLAEQGCAVVVITADVDEIVDLCDRVVVLQGGELVDELSGPHVTVEKVGLAIAQGRREGVR